MKIGRWQQFTHPVLQPLLPLQSATVRAMPIATAVILVMLMVASVALVQMHTQLYSMAFRQLLQYTLTVSIELFCTMVSEDFCLKSLLNCCLFHCPAFLRETRCPFAYGAASADKSSLFLAYYDRARFLSRGCYYLD